MKVKGVDQAILSNLDPQKKTPQKWTFRKQRLLLPTYIFVNPPGPIRSIYGKHLPYFVNVGKIYSIHIDLVTLKQRWKTYNVTLNQFPLKHRLTRRICVILLGSSQIISVACSENKTGSFIGHNLRMVYFPWLRNTVLCYGLVEIYQYLAILCGLFGMFKQSPFQCLSDLQRLGIKLGHELNHVGRH